MAKNILVPKTDLATRDYLELIQEDEDIPFEMRRKIMSVLLQMLNYKVLSTGAFVQADTAMKVRFGTNDYSAYPCEWEDDKESANAALNNKDTVEASSSSEGSDPEVREAVLSEDVR